MKMIAGCVLARLREQTRGCGPRRGRRTSPRTTTRSGSRSCAPGLVWRSALASSVLPVPGGPCSRIALGHACAQALEPLGIAQELDDLLQLPPRASSAPATSCQRTRCRWPAGSCSAGGGHRPPHLTRRRRGRWRRGERAPTARAADNNPRPEALKEVHHVRQSTAYCTVCKIWRLDGLRLGALQPQHLVAARLCATSSSCAVGSRGRRDALQLVAGPPQRRATTGLSWCRVIQPNTPRWRLRIAATPATSRAARDASAGKPVHEHVSDHGGGTSNGPDHVRPAAVMLASWPARRLAPCS